jgi:hypothetical protein
VGLVGPVQPRFEILNRKAVGGETIYQQLDGLLTLLGQGRSGNRRLVGHGDLVYAVRLTVPIFSPGNVAARRDAVMASALAATIVIA